MDKIEQWRDDMLAQGYSRNTIKVRTSTIRTLARAAGVAPEGLRREHLLAYLAGQDYAPWTRRKYVSHVRAWCAWLGTGDVTAGVRVPPAPRGLPRPISEAQLRRLLLAATPGRERAFIVLGAFCGLRSFETAKVAVEDLEQVPGGWALRVLGKGGQLALVPAPPVVVDVVQQAAEQVGGRGRLWPNASACSVQRAVRAVGVRAGVPLTSHQLRHRYGTAVYAQSRDLLLTKRVMRHASTATTEGYALVVADQASDVVNALPGADRVG